MTQVPILFNEFQALPDRIKPGLKTLTNQILTCWLTTLQFEISDSPLQGASTTESGQRLESAIRSCGKLLNIQKDYLREMGAQGANIIRPGDIGWKDKVIESLWIADERFTGLSYQRDLERDLIMREIQAIKPRNPSQPKHHFDGIDSRLTTQADDDNTWRPDLPPKEARYTPLIDKRPVEFEQTRIVMLPAGTAPRVKVPPLMIDNQAGYRRRVPDSPDQQINFDFASTSNRQTSPAQKKNLAEPKVTPPIMNSSFGPPDAAQPPPPIKSDPPPPRVLITDKPQKDKQAVPDTAGVFGPNTTPSRPPPIQPAAPAPQTQQTPTPQQDNPKAALAQFFGAAPPPPTAPKPAPPPTQPVPPPIKKQQTKESQDSDSEDIDMQGVFGGMRKRKDSTTARNARSQRLPRTVEKSDLVIKNETLFFEGFRSTKVDITDADAFKIAVNPYTLDVMIGGLNGLTFFHFNPETGLTKERFAQKNNLKLVALKYLPEKQMLVVQQPYSNTLMLLDQNFNEVKRLITEEEPTDGKPEFKSFNHSQDDTFMITRAGGKNLFIIDLEQFTIDEMVPDFWLHNDVHRNPVCVAGSRDAEIILGVSVSDEGPAFHYFNKNVIGVSKLKSEFVRKTIPDANSISAIESSEKGRSALVGGSTDAFIFFAALALDTGVKVVSKIEAKDGQYGRPFKIRRIKGTEYYIAGCAKHMLVIKAYAGRVSILRSYKDVHSDYINDLAIVRNAIFSKGRQEPYVKISYFGDNIKSIVESKDAGPSQIQRPVLQSAARINVQLLGMEKLFLSADTLQLIVANRAGIHYFRRSTKDSDFEKTKSGVLSSFGVHSAMVSPSGHLMAQETGTNDIVLLQGEGTEVARHKGKPSVDAGQLKQLVESVRRNAFSHNNNALLHSSLGFGSVCL